MERDRKLTCTLVGSFRFMDKFNEINSYLTENNIQVLSPAISRVVTINNGFKVLDVDQHFPPIEAETRFLTDLLRSDFGYIVNPGGYLGATSVTEISIARRFGVPFMSMESIDKNLDHSPNWQTFDNYNYIEVLDVESLIKKMTNIRWKLHYMYYTRQRYIPNERVTQELALKVLSSEWIKHKGLGYIIDWVKSSEHRSLLERLA